MTTETPVQPKDELIPHSEGGKAPERHIELESLAPLVETVGKHFNELEKVRGEFQIAKNEIGRTVLLHLAYIGGALLFAVLLLAAYALYSGNDAMAQGIVMAAFALFGGIGVGRLGRGSST